MVRKLNKEYTGMELEVNYKKTEYKDRREIQVTSNGRRQRYEENRKI